MPRTSIFAAFFVVLLPAVATGEPQRSGSLAAQCKADNACSSQLSVFTESHTGCVQITFRRTDNGAAEQFHGISSDPDATYLFDLIVGPPPIDDHLIDKRGQRFIGEGPTGSDFWKWRIQYAWLPGPCPND